MKGTIIEKVDIPDSPKKALIPVSTKGTIKLTKKRKNKLSALIPIPTERVRCPEALKEFLITNALISVPAKGTIISFLPVVVMWSILIPVPVKGTIDIGWQVLPDSLTALIPVPIKKYDQPISGTDRLMYALIPVPMKRARRS